MIVFRLKSKPWLTIWLVCATFGCQSMNHTQRGALAGTGLGAAAGAVIGHQSGHRGEGALLGAATGALAGGLIGNNQDVRDERDAAVAQAGYNARQAELQAMNNNDLIKLAQGGVNEQVIINAVRTRGGRFDLSPDAILNLKSNGVSDQVILSIQQASHPQREYIPVNHQPPNLYIRPEPSFFFIAPAPRRVFGPHYRYGHRHRSHW